MDGPKGDIVYIFVNIHAPTNTLSLAKPSICEKFYTDLENIFRDCKRKTQNVVILGDWNARLADRKWMDGNVIGRFALSGLRNSNGDKMAEFCRLNNMTVLNTIFQKTKSKLVTWTGFPDSVTKKEKLAKLIMWSLIVGTEETIGMLIR